MDYLSDFRLRLPTLFKRNDQQPKPELVYARTRRLGREGNGARVVTMSTSADLGRKSRELQAETAGAFS